MSLPRGYISHSQIRIYSECPKKYFYSYMEGIQPPINEKVLLGEIFHAVIEGYFGRQISGAPMDEKEVAAAFAAAFDAAASEREVKWHTPSRETRARGLAFTHYFARHIAPAIRPLMVEKELSVEIPGLGIVLKGVIDLVEEDYSITDFKTSTSRWSASKARNSPQMIIYKYLFDRNFGPIQASLKYEVLYAKNAGNIRHQTLVVLPPADAVEKLLELIGHVVENIRNGVFYAKETPFCRFCEFRGPCRQGKAS